MDIKSQTQTKDNRSPVEVLDNHLQMAKEDKLEEDLRRNYADDVVFLSQYGVHQGHEGAKYLYNQLSERLTDPTFEYENRLVEGEMGFLEWKAKARNAVVEDGADSYLIRDGKIVAQTIHYTVQPIGNT